jgi:hypothetical protein
MPAVSEGALLPLACFEQERFAWARATAYAGDRASPPVMRCEMLLAELCRCQLFQHVIEKFTGDLFAL